MHCVITAADDSKVGVTVTVDEVDGDNLRYHIAVDDNVTPPPSGAASRRRCRWTGPGRRGPGHPPRAAPPCGDIDAGDVATRAGSLAGMLLLTAAHPGHQHGYGPSLSELRPVALVIVVVLVAVWLAVVALQSRRHRSGRRGSGSDAGRAPGGVPPSSGEE